jgi:hypothetical protein
MADLPRSPDDIERLEGSPSTLRSTATDLRTIASNLTIAGTACSDLMSISDGTSWRGEGFDKFRSTLQQNPRKQDVDNAKRTMGDAAGALDRLAARLSDAQDRIERCRTRLYNLAVPIQGEIPEDLEPQLRQIRHEADDARADYRSAVREAGNRFADLTDKAVYAQPPPDFLGRAAQVVGGALDFAREYYIGIFQGTWEMIKGLAVLSYRIQAPWMWDDNVRDLRKIYLSARDNPGEFLKNTGKAVVDWDTLMSNPARWYGKLMPSVALSVATGGAGTAASTAGRAAALSSRLGRLSRVANKLDDAAGALRHVDDATNVFKTTAVGRQAARDIDAFTRPIRAGARSAARAITGRGRTGNPTPVGDDIQLPTTSGDHTSPHGAPHPEPAHAAADSHAGTAHATHRDHGPGSEAPTHHDSSGNHHAGPAHHDSGGDPARAAQPSDNPTPTHHDGNAGATTTQATNGPGHHTADPVTTAAPHGPHPVRDGDLTAVDAPDIPHTVDAPIRGHDGASQPHHTTDIPHTEPAAHVDRHELPATTHADQPDLVGAAATASLGAPARVVAYTGGGGVGLPPRDVAGPGGRAGGPTPPRGGSGGRDGGGAPPRGPEGDPPRTPPPGGSPNQGPWRDPSRYDEWRDRWFHPDRPTRTPNGEPTTVPSHSPRYPLPDPSDPIAERGIVERPHPNADDQDTRNKRAQEENRGLLEEHGFPMRNNKPAAPNPVNPGDSRRPNRSTADYQNRDDGRFWDHKVPEGTRSGPAGARNFADSLQGSATRYRTAGKQADRFVVDMTYARFTPEELRTALGGIPNLGVQEVIIVEGGVPSPLLPRTGQAPRHWPDDLPPDGGDGPGTPPPPRPPRAPSRWEDVADPRIADDPRIAPHFRGSRHGGRTLDRGERMRTASFVTNDGRIPHRIAQRSDVQRDPTSSVVFSHDGIHAETELVRRGDIRDAVQDAVEEAATTRQRVTVRVAVNRSPCNTRCSRDLPDYVANDLPGQLERPSHIAPDAWDRAMRRVDIELHTPRAYEQTHDPDNLDFDPDSDKGTYGDTTTGDLLRIEGAGIRVNVMEQAPGRYSPGNPFGGGRGAGGNGGAGGEALDNTLRGLDDHRDRLGEAPRHWTDNLPATGDDIRRPIDGAEYVRRVDQGLPPARPPIEDVLPGVRQVQSRTPDDCPRMVIETANAVRGRDLPNLPAEFSNGEATHGDIAGHFGANSPAWRQPHFRRVGGFGSYNPMAARAEAAAMLRSGHSGAQIVVHVRYTDGRSHVFNGINHDGDVYFVDRGIPGEVPMSHWGDRHLGTDRAGKPLLAEVDRADVLRIPEEYFRATHHYIGPAHHHGDSPTPARNGDGDRPGTTRHSDSDSDSDDDHDHDDTDGDGHDDDRGDRLAKPGSSGSPEGSAGPRAIGAPRTTRIYRFHDGNDPATSVPTLARSDPEHFAEATERLRQDPEKWRAASREHMYDSRHSPLLSATENPEAAAWATADARVSEPWLRGIVHGVGPNSGMHAPTLSEFEVPTSRLVGPEDDSSMRTGYWRNAQELTFLGDDLSTFLVRSGPNPYGPQGLRAGDMVGPRPPHAPAHRSTIGEALRNLLEGEDALRPRTYGTDFRAHLTKVDLRPNATVFQADISHSGQIVGSTEVRLVGRRSGELWAVQTRTDIDPTVDRAPFDDHFTPHMEAWLDASGATRLYVRVPAGNGAARNFVDQGYRFATRGPFARVLDTLEQHVEHDPTMTSSEREQAAQVLDDARTAGPRALDWVDIQDIGRIGDPLYTPTPSPRPFGVRFLNDLPIPWTAVKRLWW